MPSVSNLNDVARFFRYLAPETEIFTYCLEPDWSARFGTGTEIVERLANDASTSPFTVHTTLNRTKLTGKKQKDIESARVLCVDLDRAIPQSEIRQLAQGYKPSLIVESSPGKYHLYWKIPTSTKLEDWKLWQLGLAHHFKADKTLAQVHHLIRVPGIERMTKEQAVFLPRIVWGGETHEVVQVIAPLEHFCYGGVCLSDWISEALDEQKRKFKDIRRVVSTFGTGKVKSWAKALKEENRNETLYSVVRGVLLREKEEPSELTALAIGTKFNEALDKHQKGRLTEEEVKKTSLSALSCAVRVRGKRVEEKARVAADVKLQECAEHMNGNAFKYDYENKRLKTRFSDMAIVERVMQRFGEQFVRVAGIFYAFNAGTSTWIKQSSERETEIRTYVEMCCFDVIHDERFNQELCCDVKGAFSELLYRKAKEHFLGSRLIEAIARAVRHDASIREYPPEVFDAVPNYFLLDTGEIIDMERGNKQKARALHYMLHSSKIEWNPIAEAPGWQSFLREVFAENEDPEACIRMLQQIFGYSLSGHMSEQKVFIHHGDGCNGKSKVLSALTMLAGGYATAIAADELVSKSGKFIQNLERFGAKIEGKRVAIVDDADVKAEWNEGMLKSVTAEVLRAEDKWEKSREFKNRCKLHLACNQIPAAQTENFGVLRRLCIIEYKRQFKSDAKKGDEIDAMIQAEAPGIMAWAYKGYTYYRQARHIEYTAEQERAVEEYKADNFTLENTLRDLYALSTEEGGSFVTDVVEHVNQYLQSQGQIIALNTKEIVQGIKRVFKVSSKREWCKERHNSFMRVPIILKNGKDDGFSILNA